MPDNRNLLFLIASYDSYMDRMRKQNGVICLHGKAEKYCCVLVRKGRMGKKMLGGKCHLLLRNT